jgi:serine/threonine protein kinase
MLYDDTLLELLHRWEEGRDQGKLISPEELCAGCPHLLEAVKQAIGQLRQVDPLFRQSSQVTRAARTPIMTESRPTPPSNLERALALDIPGFQPLGVLGRGGMGAVYKVRHIESDQVMALKVILMNREVNVTTFARFGIEGKAVSCLGHPNIVQILGFAIHSGIPYMLLEYVPGGSLADKIGRNAQPPTWSAQLVQCLAEAMQYCHQRGILHRDLKPANVLLAEDGTPKISDFGLARFATPPAQILEISPQKIYTMSDDDYERFIDQFIAEDMSARQDYQYNLGFLSRDGDFEHLISTALSNEQAAFLGEEAKDGIRSWMEDLLRKHRNQLVGHYLTQVTRSHQVMGTPRYMAPEQAWGDNDQIGPHTDVYGLGAILYQLLTGHAPKFRGLLNKPVDKEPPGPIGPEVPRELKAVCFKCLEMRIENRYQTAQELADDLRRFLTGDVVVAKFESLEGTAPVSRAADDRLEEPWASWLKLWGTAPVSRAADDRPQLPTCDYSPPERTGHEFSDALGHFVAGDVVGANNESTKGVAPSSSGAEHRPQPSTCDYVPPWRQETPPKTRRWWKFW